MIVTENKTGEKYRIEGREKRIYWNNNGDPYFMLHGRRQYLNNIERISYPIMYYKKNPGNIDGIISGILTISNSLGYYVEIIEGREAAQLFTPIEA